MFGFMTARDFFKKQEKPFLVNMIRVAFTNFFIWLVLPIQSIYLTDLGFSPTEIGWATGISGIGGGILSLLVSIRVPYVGIKRMFLIGITGLSIGSLTLAIVRFKLLILLGIFMFMCSMYVLENICPIVCGVCLNNKIRLTGMQTCDALSSVPKLAAPVVGALLVAAFGGPNIGGIFPLYLIVFAGSCIIYIIIWKFFHNPTNLILQIERSPHNSNISGVTGILFLLKQNKNLKIGLIIRTLAQAPFYMAIIYIPLFVIQVKHASEFTLGFMQSAMWASTLLLAIPSGILADRLGRKKLITALVLISIMAILLLINANSRTSFVVAGFLQGFFFLALVTTTGMLIEFAPKSAICEWVGVQGLFKGVIAQLSPALAGIVWVLLGPYHVLYLMIACFLIVLCLLVLVPETLQRDACSIVPRDIDN